MRVDFAWTWRTQQISITYVCKQTQMLNWYSEHGNLQFMNNTIKSRKRDKYYSMIHPPVCECLLGEIQPDCVSTVLNVKGANPQ